MYLGYLQVSFHFYLDVKKEPQSPLESDDFFMFPKHLEMLGDKAKDCGVSLSLEWTRMETEASDNVGFTYILYRWKNTNGQGSPDQFMYVMGKWKAFLLFVLFLGGLPQISSRAAVWRRHAYTPYSSTPCTLVIIFQVTFRRHHVYFTHHKVFWTLSPSHFAQVIWM